MRDSDDRWVIEIFSQSLGLNINVLVPAGTAPDAKLPVVAVRLLNFILSTHASETYRICMSFQFIYGGKYSQLACVLFLDVF